MVMVMLLFVFGFDSNYESIDVMIGWQFFKNEKKIWCERLACSDWVCYTKGNTASEHCESAAFFCQMTCQISCQNGSGSRSIPSPMCSLDVTKHTTGSYRVIR